MSVEQAKAFWQGLAIVVQRNILHLEPMQGAWVVGQHGDQPVAIILKPDGQIGFYAFIGHPGLQALPKFTCHAGRHSLVETLRSNSPSQPREALVWQGNAEELGATLHDFFIYHATKPFPAEQPIEIYNASKKGLRTSSAEAVIKDAFQSAVKAAKPSDQSIFGDRWARAALAYVMNEETDLGILTRGDADKLNILRVCNVHRTRQDLVAQARALNMLLEVLEEDTRLQSSIQPGLPYLGAQRAYLSAFRHAYAQALNGGNNRPRAFSQRLIKGLLLAKACGARLAIGSLFEAVSADLVARYGQAWPFMQAVEVVGLGRPSPELKVRKEMGEGAGTFSILDQQGTVLDPPRVLLEAQEALFNPNKIFHEFQHARQHMAAEGSIYDFEPQEWYKAEVTECQAKQAEAHFIAEFGILY